MVFVFDENISNRIVNGFKAFGEDVIHITEEFPKGTKDEDWIPKIGKKGWILITNDYHIDKKQHQAQAFREAQVSAFFIDVTVHPDLWGWIEFYVKRWRKFCELAQDTSRPFVFKVTMRSIQKR